jgi:hypothetical protein
MKIQFTEKDLEGSYIPNDGQFLVRITKVELGTSKKGDQKLTVDFTGLGDVAGKTTRNDISLTQHAKFRVRDLFLAAGFTSEQLQTGVDHAELVGKVILLKRKPRSYVGSDGTEKQGANDYYQKPSPNQLEELGIEATHTAPDEDIPF